MNTDLATQLRLLDLQAADTQLAQLAHRRRSLPELAAIGVAQTEVSTLEHRAVDVRTEAADIDAEQRRLEADVATVRARAAKDEQRLRDGGVPARELTGLQHEIASLARRQNVLEDEVLEVMERAESAQQQERNIGVQLADGATRLSELTARRDEAFAEIDSAEHRCGPERDALAEQLPADLLALYDKARAGGGAGAALVRQRRCEACRIELSGTELSALRKAGPEFVARCENCRAILVRTAESGL